MAGSARLINDLWYKNAVIYCLSVATHQSHEVRASTPVATQQHALAAGRLGLHRQRGF